MNTPRTDALNKHIHALPKTTSDWIEWVAQYAELSRQLETQVVELREALEGFMAEFGDKTVNVNVRKARAILEKLEKTK